MTASDIQMMIPAVVLVLALAAAGLSVPLPTQEQVSAGHVVPQILTKDPTAQFVDETKVEDSPDVYSPIGQVLQANTPVPRGESVPENADQTQPNYSENPVLLPLQPLSVVPVREVGPVPRPVTAPAEAITAGRVIVAGIESVQKRSYQQDEVVGSPMPYQQTIQQVQQVYKPMQPQGVELGLPVQPHEKQTPLQQQQYSQLQSNLEPLIREEIVTVNPLQQNVENPVQQHQQMYSVPENVHPINTENLSFQVPVYVPVQTVQQPQVQHGEKQASYEDISGNVEVQNHELQPTEHQYQVYSGQPIVARNVEKKVPQQQSSEYSEQVYNAQEAVKKQGEYQQVNSYMSFQNQQVDEELFDKHPVVEKQGHYQTQGAELHQQQVQPVQEVVENQVLCEQPVQRSEPLEPQQPVHNVQPVIVDQVQPVQANPVKSVDQQQVYTVQPIVVDRVLSQVPHEQIVQQEAVDYVPEQISKSSDVEHQEPYNNVQPQEIHNYATETLHNYVEKTSQQNIPAHIVSEVSQTQDTSGQTSVIPTQE